MALHQSRFWNNLKQAIDVDARQVGFPPTCRVSNSYSDIVYLSKIRYQILELVRKLVYLKAQWCNNLSNVVNAAASPLKMKLPFQLLPLGQLLNPVIPPELKSSSALASSAICSKAEIASSKSRLHSASRASDRELCKAFIKSPFEQLDAS